MGTTKNHIVSLGRIRISLPDTTLGYMMLVLRLALGVMLLQSGLGKFLDSSGWVATGYLEYAATGPFATTFASWSGPVVNNLVMWGEVLIGISLILGIGVRWASFWGAVMILLFYLSQLPPEHWWINDKLVYILVFITLITSRVGTVLGVDTYLVKYQNRYHFLKYVLG